MGHGESKLLQKFSAITYELDIGQRLTAFDRDGSLHDMLQIIWPHLEPKLDSVIDSFLETLMSFDEVQGRIEDATDTIRARQREFWEIVFTRPIDMTYGQMISERGVVMHQRGILPRGLCAHIRGHADRRAYRDRGRGYTWQSLDRHQ